MDLLYSLYTYTCETQVPRPAAACLSPMSHMPQAYQCMTTSERVHSVSSLCPGPTKRGREPTRVCKMACVAIVSNGKLEGPLGKQWQVLRSSGK